MVTIPKNSHDGAAGEIFDVKTSVYHGLVSMRTQAQTLTSTSSSSVDNPYGDGRGVTVRTRSMLTKIRNQKGSWWLEPLIYFFLFGFTTTLSLNFIHLHRLTFSGESNNFHNVQHELSRLEPIDSVQDETQEVSACLIVMDDNHFLIGKEIHREKSTLMQLLSHGTLYGNTQLPDRSSSAAIANELI